MPALWNLLCVWVWERTTTLSKMDNPNVQPALDSLASETDGPSSSSKLRDAVNEVIEGFGLAAERRPRDLGLAAVEAFMDVEKKAAPLRRRRLDAALKSIRTLKIEPSIIDLCDDDDLRDAGIIELCRALFRHGQLKELLLARTGAGFSAASAVASVVSVHLKLRRLEMSGNPLIGDEGTSSLALALQSSRCLERLELRASGVGDAGASALARAMMWRRHHTPLTHLDLSFNKEITSEGVEALRDAASRCAPLRMLALAGTTATPALLASAVFAATAAGKVAMEGAELWNQGVHSEYTLRFAPHVDAPLIAP